MDRFLESRRLLRTTITGLIRLIILLLFKKGEVGGVEVWFYYSARWNHI